MIGEYQQKSNTAIIVGIVLWLVGGAIVRSGGSLSAIGSLISVVGSIAWAYGCAMLAQAKGQNPIVGALLGFFCGCIGWAIIYFALPDQA